MYARHISEAQHQIQNGGYPEIASELSRHVLAADAHAGSPGKEEKCRRQLICMSHGNSAQNEPQSSGHDYKHISKSFCHMPDERCNKHHYHQITHKP